MKVYRLEYADDRHHGPFGIQENPIDVMFGQPPESPEPAIAAQVAAKLDGVKGPYEMPGIARDGVTVQEYDRFVKNHPARDLVFGFTSMEQYHEWFRTPLVRKALFLQVSRASHGGEGYNNLELRCYNIAEKDVLFGGHQVMFALEDAKADFLIPREEAIA